ncbi:MAG: LLM class F420-dependent oxidoreductase [Actinomycetota bacterium]|jgi:probable F420-dependent oxidoreductase|nr:LLM class F420-dependent oxidoreductase [Actinomycetota bacterium]
MDLGFFTMNTDHSIPIDRLARELEARGYESLWVGEHSHIPVHRETPYPGGGELPDAYTRMADPFVSLMAAGAATENLRLGTGVCLILERDLIATAKTAATLDQLTEGRLIMGVGCGWNLEELRNHQPDLPFKKRYGAMRERVAALRNLWTDDEASFHGAHVDFDPVHCFPKPVQSPHPPVMLGNWGPVGIEHVIEYADEWGPVDSFFHDPVAQIRQFRQQCEDAGRDPASIPITIFATAQPPIGRLASYREAGAVRVVLGTGHPALHRADKAITFIDRYVEAIAKLA